MVKFLDGPAAGVVLELRRAPVFLRVLQDTRGLNQWDACDQLTDAPCADEIVTVYVRIGAAGWIHIDFQDKAGRRRGETYATAEYRLHAEQPPEAVMRETSRWRAWAQSEWDRIRDKAAGTESAVNPSERQT